MANTHQAGIKKDDHGGCSRNQQPQAAPVAPDQLRGGVKGDGLGGGHDVETTSMLKNCKKNSATDGGGRSSMIEILRRGAESVTLRHDDDPHHPSLPEPEGVQFVLHTLPVKKDCIGDGDGFTAYVKKASGVAVSGSYKKGDTNNRAPQQYRIRMRGIDAPELKMEYGAESRNELVKLIGGKCVTIHVYGMDQYERYLGDIYCDGIFIQEEMLKRGFAWYFKTGEKRPELARWEREAREARQGLWSLDNPQKPWEWKRDHPRNNKKEAANDIQVETLPWLICKDMETLGREWKKKLEKIVAEKMELNDHLQELKRNKNEAEDRAKELEKEMGSVVADNMKLNDQLEESKKNRKKADDRILKLTFFSESVAAVNMDLHDKLEESKKNKEKDDDQILKLTFFSESVAAVNIDLHDKLEKLKKMNKKAEDRAKELEKEMESVVAVNRELNAQVQELKGNKKLTED